MPQARPRVIVVAGPTASGKSDLALALAGEFAGVVINADSQQRYRDFPILTAQPGADDKARAPHRLFGDLAAHEVSTAAEWAVKAAREIESAREAGAHPIVVGGTGLYLRVLMQGFAEIPPIPDEVRAAARELLAKVGNAEFHRRLAERDPHGAAHIPPGNSQRLARAWEVIEATGTPLSVWQEAPPAPALTADYFSILLMPPREILVAAAAARFGAMMAAGALAEVERAIAAGVAQDAPAMNALGARELADHLRGQVSLEAAVGRAEIATRQYAKRQATWFRHQFRSSLTLDTRYTDRMRATIVSAVRDFLGGAT